MNVYEFLRVHQFLSPKYCIKEHFSRYDVLVNTAKLIDYYGIATLLYFLILGYKIPP